VVRDPAAHKRVLEKVAADLTELGLGLRGLMVSPLLGPAGNVEFLGWWAQDAKPANVQDLIEQTLDDIYMVKRSNV
jgi:23S rRNA (cytidine1920-2'-O)/16S rRNA (cytidine1409-2'-O)-methyltransferase